MSGRPQLLTGAMIELAPYALVELLPYLNSYGCIIDINKMYLSLKNCVVLISQHLMQKHSFEKDIEIKLLELANINIEADRFKIEELRDYSEMKGSIAFTHPDLSLEWHPDMNGTLKPTHMTFGSNKKVWWRCKNRHAWEATVSSRCEGTGCPYCSGRMCTEENSLTVVDLVLSKQWHPVKNDNLTPSNVKLNSHKIVWWLCPTCGCEWDAMIKTRNRGFKKCPECCSQ